MAGELSLQRAPSGYLLTVGLVLLAVQAAVTVNRARNTGWRQLCGYLHRCLVGDSAHDLEVVFRLVQLWLSLGAEAGTVRQLRTAFKATPSHKFLPLMYQMASRLSAAAAGPLVSSGFQASFTAVCQRSNSCVTSVCQSFATIARNLACLAC